MKDMAQNKTNTKGVVGEISKEKQIKMSCESN